ncbi:MAG: PP2C family protein-serine/threonine phosphatase, partial [Gemmataceae bacterium]
PVVRAQRVRHGDPSGDYGFSRTIVQKALDEGVGLLSEDVRGDRNLVLSATMVSLNLRSFLCVPLIGWEGRRLGILQLDCIRPGMVFRPDDLEMLTAIGLQAAVVLQNATFHAERIREERLRQEVMMARDIQSQFLPATFELAGPGAQLFARCVPAREVSGDLYDFFPLPDGRLAFFIGDVSGKGMSAALFMIAVRTLARYFGPTATGAADFLHRLNNALARDNPTHLYVTMVFGIYDGKDGSLTLARGGHPAPILRRADGVAAPMDVKPGLMLGSTELPKPGSESKVTLGVGETLILYTDGYHEAAAADNVTQFGVPRICEVMGRSAEGLTLEAVADRATAAVRAFAPGEQQDDMTLLLLRRC